MTLTRVKALTYDHIVAASLSPLTDLTMGPPSSLSPETTDVTRRWHSGQGTGRDE